MAELPITFAHRGARLEHPENTIAAFRHALEHGARGLETDAWMCGDHEVVLVHDGVVRSALRRLRVGSTSAERIALKDDRVGAAILEIAGHHGALDRAWLCSPDRKRLRELRDAATDVKLVHSTWKDHVRRGIERHAAELADDSIDAMNLHHSEWTAGLVSLFHRFDVRAFAWDTQEVRQLRAMLQLDIDAVYCDHVDRMVATVAEWTTRG